jgi:hypothetical protein
MKKIISFTVEVEVDDMSPMSLGEAMKILSKMEELTNAWDLHDSKFLAEEAE